MKNTILLLLTILIQFRCNTPKEKADNCVCMIPESIDAKKEKEQDSSNQTWDVGSNNDIETVVKKALNAKISITGSYSNSDSKIEEVYSEIIGSNPDITQKANLYRSIACAYYDIICQDKTLNDKEKVEKLKEVISGYEKNINKILADTPAINSAQENKNTKATTRNKNLNQSIPESEKINQKGKNNLFIEGDNKGSVSVGDIYNKPPQRHATSEDLDRIFRYAPNKNTKIKVISNGGVESNIFRDEILNKLSQKGYINLIESVVGQSMNYFGTERLTIRDGKYNTDSWVEIIVNPQE